MGSLLLIVICCFRLQTDEQLSADRNMLLSIESSAVLKADVMFFFLDLFPRHTLLIFKTEERI